MRRHGPHEELTDPENEKILGTYTPRGWRGLAVAEVRARFYAVDPDDPEFGELHPLVDLVHIARQSSGSIHGKHREDLKDAIIGAPVLSGGLSVRNAADEERATEPAARKRGL